MLYRILYTFFAALILFCTHAQIVPSKRYTTSDGLASDRLTCVVQDEQGFLWTGSYYGLSRYDGYRFENITLPQVQQNKYVSALAATDGAVYAGFLFGGGLMEYHQGKTSAFILPSYKGTAFNSVLALCPHYKKGVLVCGSGNAVYEFANGVFRFLFALDSSYLDINWRYLAMDKGGNTWIATDKGMLVFTSGKLMPVSSDPTFSIQPFEKGVIAVSRINGVTVASFVEIENGVFKSKKLIETVPIAHVPQNNFLPGVNWLLDTSGSYVYVTHEGVSTSFRVTGVTPDEVEFLYSDRENNLWIATHNGLVKKPNLPSRFYPFRELAFAAGFITGNDSALWINNGRHLYLIRNDMEKEMKRMDINFPGTLFYTENELWIGDIEKGLCRLSLDNNKIQSIRYFQNFGKIKIKVHTITRDREGGIWAGGENGIFYLRDGTPAAHFTPPLRNGEPAFIVGMVVDAKSQVIWAGDNGQGLLKISYKFSGPSIHYEVQEYIDSARGLTDGHVRSMLLDSKGALWVGTRFSGVFRITENDRGIQVQNLSGAAGMSCNRVTDIKEVGNRAIWVSSCSGIFRYDHDSGKWKGYTTADGLTQAEVFASYVSRDEQRCWSVSETGVTIMDLSAKKEVPPPLINLIRITVLGEEDSTISKQQATAYEPNESSIGFQFAAASYTDERKIWYKYRLEGYDQNWSAPTQSNSVNYASLSPGEYTFKVLASVDNKKWSVIPASFAFRIKKPFYKSPLFFILIVGTLMVAVYFIYTYRLRQKLKLERMRSRISGDLHDDIGSTLSSISIISEGAFQEKDPAASKLMMKEISENTQLLMDKIDDIIWCVNPQNDSFQQLMMRIQKFSSALFEARGIDYTITIDKHINDLTLPMTQRQHLYLVLKEAVNNLVKYSGATHATINVLYEGGYLIVKVTDNGKGFDIRKQQTGNGLRNMKRRAEMMRATLKIESNDNGTTVFLRSKTR